MSAITLLITFSALLSCTAALTCLDANNQPVDHFYSLKHNHGYNYSTYNEGTKEFSQDEYLHSLGGHVSNTLHSLYLHSNHLSTAFMFANDQSPYGQKSSTKAHLKVVLATDSNSGFWLIHSVPRYPISPKTFNSTGYNFPLNEIRYGQSFLCLTLPTSQFETVAKAMYINQPFIYDSNMPPHLQNVLPTLNSVFQGNYAPGKVAKTLSVTTVGGKLFTIFAKNRAWGKELYSDMVAPYYQSGMYVESWLNGRGKLGTWCKPYKVFDVQNLTLPDGSHWKETQDHAKWGVTIQKSISCVGDINRQHGQMNRGGGTYCTDDHDIWNAFNTLITGYNNSCT